MVLYIGGTDAGVRRCKKMKKRKIMSMENNNNNEVSFEFAFNNPLFSDRQLVLEIAPSITSERNLSGNVADNSCMKVLHVSSLLLAAHSDYFKRLFSNGMSESHSRSVAVKLSEEELQGFCHLIQYMYTGHLKDSLDAESTITLLRLADRFAITSCMKGLAEVLQRLPGTVNRCLLVLGLPESLKAAKMVQPVVEHFSNFLTHHFADISIRKSEFLLLSPEAVKIVLDSDILNVSYEEEVFDYLLDWLNANCQIEEEKRRAAEEISVVVRFPWMTGDFLVDVVNKNPCMSSVSCQELILEAIKFRSLTHARQQIMMSERAHHNRYRPRNTLILENFWGISKTNTVYLSETSCQVYFEFPLELVICTGQNFQSRPFSLLGGKYNFYLEAKYGQVKTCYGQQITCYVSLVFPLMSVRNPMDANSGYIILEYALAMKRDHSESYNVQAKGIVDLQSAETGNRFIAFNDLFPGWRTERGFSFPRWNLTINGPVFLCLDICLKDRQS